MKRVLRITKCECGTLYPTLNYLGVCGACRRVWHEERGLCHFTPQQALLFPAILFSQRLSREEIINILWPFPDNEPEDPKDVIGVQLFRMTRKLFPFLIYRDGRGGVSLGITQDYNFPEWLSIPPRPYLNLKPHPELESRPC